ncbi:N-acetylmuramoyl-L-alanine amidase-like domain-containing protein [Geofilum sp. OHC36d9]|uniref:N-acetylmuramoyl-L-alanine amidase-like domain-containing protein n=1 Tax=Geofilum sp. OHC36d9 TaxID=3458413 RepID=UPI0040348728
MRQLSLLISIFIFWGCHHASSRTGGLVDHSSDIICTSQDSLIFEDWAKSYQSAPETDPSWSNLLPAIGRQFLGTPYVAKTLEVPGNEHLVVNLREMDCTTFLEYVLAMATIVRHEELNWNAFCDALVRIRYRNGRVEGFPSRLHYFTEWMHHNNLLLISDSLGDAALNTNVDFMSRNPQYYRQLKDDTTLIKAIRNTEQHIAGYNMRFITRDHLPLVANYIRNGDIIAFVSSVSGLDVSHTALALWVDGDLHLLHASTRQNRVEVSPVSLTVYLEGMSTVTGILIGRMP